MEKSPGGTYELPVELNGVLKLSFIFDSGASDVSISPYVMILMRNPVSKNLVPCRFYGITKMQQRKLEEQRCILL